MNLPKAKELLQQDLNEPGSVDIIDLNKAQEIGIEAINIIEQARKGNYLSIQQPLPGETEE